MRDLAALGVVAGETGAASLAGLRALCPRGGSRGRRARPLGPWCCAPRAPPTPSPTNASWARLPRTTVSSPWHVGVYSRLLGTRGTRLTYGERPTRRAQGEDDRGVQPVRSRHPDQPVPRVPVAARRSARVPERGDRVLGPVPLRRRARRAPRPRHVRLGPRRDHRGLRQGQRRPHQPRRAQPQLAPQAGVAAVHAPRDRRPRAQGACHRRRCARRRTRQGRDRHRRRVLHPPPDDGDRGDARAPDGDTRRAAPLLRRHPRPLRSRRGGQRQPTRPSRRWARSWCC